MTQTAFIDEPARSGQAAGSGAVIGPNAVLQLVTALAHAGLGATTQAIFAMAGASLWLEIPPATMIDELRVGRLHRAVRAALPSDRATEIMVDAGRLTAEYLLANRIPKPVQIILKLLPSRLAARILVKAITAHAWTFAGSGRFSAKAGLPTIFELRGNPLCAGEHSDEMVCAWHAAVFQRLFEALVSPNARVVETACEARGDDRCAFELWWA
jgi:divinyl protochlorophyllide a 8-vinyl-reductase